MKPLLLDTGPVVALLDADDAWHEQTCRQFRLLPASRNFVTTSAVVTEIMFHLRRAVSGHGGPSSAVVTEIMFHLQDCHRGPERAAAFLEDARVAVNPMTSAPELRAAAALMEKYAAVPMDFADASLVLLAAHHGTGDIVTLDERGFRTYRYHRHQPFRLMLQEAD